MKRIVLLALTLLLVVSLMKVEATVESGFLPGGKNYLDYNNFTVSSNEIVSNDSIRVKPNTMYTLTYPSNNLLGNTSVYVYGNYDYLDGYAYNLDECTELDDLNVCTFEIRNDDFISIYITGDTIGLYDSYYGFDLYQLEEGVESTSYEEYISPIHDTTSPEFNSTGAYITSYQDLSSVEDILQSHVFAIDEIDGDVSDRIQIESDDYTQNIGIVGNYSVSISVSDFSNNISYFELIILVKDEINPVIEGLDFVDVDVDDHVTVDSVIQDNYTIYDEYDGPLSYTITSDDYTINHTLLGSYLVTFETVDSSGNKTSKTITVNTVDYDAPLLLSNSIYNTDVTYFESLNDIVNQLEFLDNYDSTYTKTIISNNYENNEDQIGTYFVDITVSDSSQNEETYTITINVIDTILPIITGVESVSYSYINPPTIEDIKAMLSVSDNHDLLSTNDLVIISNDYFTRSSDIGNFFITFEINDAAFNKATFTVDIELVDDQAPIIFVDNYIVKINPTVSFTKEDAILLMFRNDLLEEDEYEIEVLLDEYTNHETEQGMYLYQLKFTNDDGESFVKDFVIEVLGEEDHNYSSLITSAVLLIGFVTLFIIKKRK